VKVATEKPRNAAHAAVDAHVESGMTVGPGSGSTAYVAYEDARIIMEASVP
jgi:ribose 5-phosphate isomerase